MKGAEEAGKVEGGKVEGDRGKGGKREDRIESSMWGGLDVEWKNKDGIRAGRR